MTAAPPASRPAGPLVITAPSPDLVLAMLADARLPVGAHTQSGGLEPAMAHGGLGIADVPGYLRGRLATVTAVEAGTAVVARHVLLAARAPGASEAGPDAGPDGEPDAGADAGPALAEVEDAWAARTPSAALREAARSLGRGYLRLARRLWPHDPALAALAGRRSDAHAPRPVVLGVVAALAGLDAARLVRLVGHDDVATVCAAALKLDPLDPAETALWTLAAHPAIEALVPALAPLTSPDQIPAASAPLLERWAQLHPLTPQRLFRA